jgi:hypothetical protein
VTLERFKGKLFEKGGAKRKDVFLAQPKVRKFNGLMVPDLADADF